MVGEIKFQDGPRSGFSLVELRALHEATKDMPERSEITVRTGFGGGNRHGSRITRLTVVTPTESPQ